MNSVRRTLILVVIGALACSAQAGLVFSDVVIAGSLADGASYYTSGGNIDFMFPDALVGDPVNPLRAGNLIITFEVRSTEAIDRSLVSILGGLSGSGMIDFNEVVEDLVTPGVIGAYGAVMQGSGALPHIGVVGFDRPTTHYKVKKTAVLSAVDTDELDLAAVALIEQNMVPEPGTAALLLVGLVALRRR